MKMIALIVGLAAGSVAFAAPGSLTLEQYLEQVRTQNPEGRALSEALAAAELRLNEADVALSSEAYAEYHLMDDRMEPTNPFLPVRTKGTTWRAGVRDETTFGFSSDFFVENNHINLIGVEKSFFIPRIDYFQTALGAEFKQSLWRNGFGTSTRADVDRQRSASRIEMLQQKFDLKNLLLRAENTYWSLVSYGQIVQLQEENLDRVTKLRDWMRRREGMRLVDDVDALQAQASLETRELELMSSVDERAALMRQFNTLRGQAIDEVDELAELPTADFLLQIVKDPSKRMSREDFAIVYERAKMAQTEARAKSSQIAPQLDLVGGIRTNGMDEMRSVSFDEIQEARNPTWNVGIMFSVPLDYSLIGSMRRAYKAQSRAADAHLENARFAEERAWDDVVKQRSDAQKRFQKSVSLEKLQTQLVKRERQRLLNGRTTTFQTITFEQNLALAQIQRVRAQLSLLQVHNVIKSYEASL